MYKCLDKFDVHVSDEEKERLEILRGKWVTFGEILATSTKVNKL
jgi:hypothetical protein